jgi:hypothetical protein
MDLEPTQLNALSQKVASTLGAGLMDYSPQQKVLFEQAMGRVLRRHQGNVEAVTPQEIIGAQKLVLDHLLPIDLQKLQENY